MACVLTFLLSGLSGEAEAQATRHPTFLPQSLIARPYSAAGPAQKTPAAQSRSLKTPQRRHVTAHLLRRQAQYGAKFGRVDADGSSTAAPPVLGTVHTFFSRDVLDQTQWRSVAAELVRASSHVRIWVETTAADTLRPSGQLDHLLDGLTHRLERSTPPGAYAPNHGVLATVASLFGPAPNSDGDGVLDLLLLDVRDQFQQTGGFVAGFFDPVDLTEHPSSNRRDLLHVDLFPTILYRDSVQVDRAAATIAHEYQHLIHAGFDTDGRESVFVNEGLSEYAEILCGFEPRPADAFLNNPSRGLLSWTYDDPLPDYARASLWTHYLFDRIGTEHAAALVRNPRSGIDGIRDVLREAGAPPFEVLFEDWGEVIAFGADASVPGYEHPARKNLRRRVQHTVDAFPRTELLTLPPLSHALVHLPLVKSASVHLPGDRIETSVQRTFPGGKADVVRLSVAGQTIPVDAHPHGSASILLTNLEEEKSREVRGRGDAVPVLLAARPSAHRRLLSFDDGAADPFSGSASFLLLDDDAAIGLVFAAPESGWLYGISTQLLFLSEVAGSGIDATVPRTVRLSVHTFDDGRPGPPIGPAITKEVGRPFGNLQVAFIDLEEAYASLASVPDSFVVRLASGSPGNPLAVALDRATGARAPSFLQHNRGDLWSDLSTVVAGGSSLQGFQPIIRAHLALSPHVLPPHRLEARFDYDPQGVRVELEAPFAVDAARVHLGVQWSAGGVVSPDSLMPSVVALGGHRVTQPLPLRVDAEYVVHATLWSTDGEQWAEGTFPWRLPETHSVHAGPPYPNPAVGPVRIPLLVLEASEVAADVYDLLGRRLQSIPFRRYTAGSSLLPLTLRGASGRYFVRLTVRRIRDGHTRMITHPVSLVR
jgi:hypothetical protein